MFSIKQKAMQSAKRAGFMTGGFAFCAVGLGFFTLAAWFYLSIEFTALQAALIIGAAYFGVGLVLVGMGKSSTHLADPTPQHPAPEQPDAPPLVQALMYGIQAGINTSKPKR
jgi:multisubunit Na+/H+ antiporter MnhC subunit